MWTTFILALAVIGLFMVVLALRAWLKPGSGGGCGCGGQGKTPGCGCHGEHPPARHPDQSGPHCQ